MSFTAAAGTPSTELIDQLGAVCADRGLPTLATDLTALRDWIADDLAAFETELRTLPRGACVVRQSAHHLLDLGGKHLRPMCVVLAAKLGVGFERARDLAVAVELVHSATLLHDDVVDLGDTRRGAPAARLLFGNAASIFAGDWLLVAALRRIRAAGIPGLLDDMLATIEQMILAEAIQLESRGRINADPEAYFRVVEGKTASLFRWAMLAGARAGGLDDDQCAALCRFGLHLGVAFQAVDDLLDYAGDAAMTGKELFADLREGKMTYPLILAVDRDPTLLPVLEDVASRPAAPVSAAARARVLDAMIETRGFADCMAMARRRARAAISELDALPDGPGKRALVTVAEATVHREN